MKSFQKFLKTITPWQWAFLALAMVGIIDCIYLSYEHYAKVIPPCQVGVFVDCGQVLMSKYAIVFGVPLAVLGLLHYSGLFVATLLALYTKEDLWKRLVFLMTAVGVIASIYFVYLQVIVIGAICIYCMVSAINSFALYFVARRAFRTEYQKFFLAKSGFAYRYLVKPILFLFSPEVAHNRCVGMGALTGKWSITRNLLAHFYSYKNPHLHQKIADIHFPNPVGLAAGFDYNADLTQSLGAVGFGFQTVGTITNHPYAGNPSPMLGRLPKSHSLMVNKGFKNLGAEATVSKLQKKHFSIPVGISIGMTNTVNIKTVTQAVEDIIETFKTFEKSGVKNSFYELNISCPNLQVRISLYEPKNVKILLEQIDKLKIKKPIFIKMPISKTDTETKHILDEIVKHKIAGVIFGNLQTDRKDPTLHPDEVRQWKVGNFSGKPTQKRSDELVELAYSGYGKKLIIIGTGGIFSAQDAYKKIRLGASLVQLITGMIYQGPQLISQINMELVELLAADGYKNIEEAVGVDVQ